MKIQHIVIYGIIALSGALLWRCSSSTGDKQVDITPPAVPTGLTITDISDGSISLNWNPVEDRSLEGYNVYWRGGSEADTLNANRRFVTTNYTTISGLDYDIIYFIAVSSVDNSGNESALSIQQRGQPSNNTFPAPPSGVDVVAENTDFLKITIFWAENKEPDFAYYKLYRALSTSDLEDSTASFVTTLTKENYIDVDVEVGVKYYYRITAVDKGGWESAPSATVTDLVLTKVTLISPLDFEYVGTTPVLKWEEVTGAVKYILVVTTSRIGGEIWNVEVDSTTTQIIYQGKTRLISGNTYYWKIGAISRREINSISDVGAFVVRVQ